MSEQSTPHASAGGDDDGTPPREGMVPRRNVDGAIIEWLDVPARAAELGLEPHPEGGWYRRTWTAGARIQAAGGERPAATLIHFLLPAGEVSAWHRVTSDEIWLWHGPAPLLLQLGGDGGAPDARDTIALDLATPQGLVPAGHWQRTLPGDAEVLVSCVVSPGFSFEDFTLADDAGADAGHDEETDDTV